MAPSAASGVGCRQRSRLCTVLYMATLALCVGRDGARLVRAESLVMPDYGGQEAGERMSHHTMQYYAPEDRGCALCRSEQNCSLAVHNQSEGVFCGDLMSTFQPCCCAFRNECMTTIFSDSCECFDGQREQQLVSTRFYLFVGLSFVAWALLLYDKMCAGPYKVMNSSHQLLATTPSAAQDRSTVATADSDSEDEREQRRDGEDASTSPDIATSDAADAVDETEADWDVALRPRSSESSTEATESSNIVVTVDASAPEPAEQQPRQSRQPEQQDGRDAASVQSV